MFNLDRLTRANIRVLKPYSSARDEFSGQAAVFLDANENPFNTPCNRYPDPLQRAIKQKIAEIRHVRPEQIFLGNGSDEPIDLIFRAFCEPGIDNVVAIEPTYGMYGVAAGINDIVYRKVLLNDDFSLDADRLLRTVDRNTKAVFLCSPNNPTGNTLQEQAIEKIVNRFEGLVVLDEAYNDFSDQPSWLSRLDQTPNVIVLQTFSKAWGLAGIRLGMAFASPEIIALLTKIKYPYNINVLTQNAVLEALQHRDRVEGWIRTLRAERERMASIWPKIPCIEKIFPSEANFILIRTADPQALYDYLVARGVIVRNRNSVAMCQGCLRLTIGTPAENDILTEALRAYSSDTSSLK